jgi:hypothetical protein
VEGSRKVEGHLLGELWEDPGCLVAWRLGACAGGREVAGLGPRFALLGHQLMCPLDD